MDPPGGESGGPSSDPAHRLAASWATLAGLASRGTVPGGVIASPVSWSSSVCTGQVFDIGADDGPASHTRSPGRRGGGRFAGHSTDFFTDLYGGVT